MDDLPPPVVRMHAGIWVVRDDLILGGTKARIIPRLFVSGNEYVYPSPAQGMAQCALAYAAQRCRRSAVIYCAARAERHPNTQRAADAGARIVEVRPGYLSVVKARAREYCNATGATLLPWGLACPEMILGVADLARGIGIEPPDEVWCCAGSGTLARGLRIAWPRAVLYAVQVGAEIRGGLDATVIVAPEKYEQPAKMPPPFPSAPSYDAKVWQFVRGRARQGRRVLLWNVAS